MKAALTVIVLSVLGLGATHLSPSNQTPGPATRRARGQAKEDRIRVVYKGAGGGRSLRQVAAEATRDVDIKLAPGLVLLSSPNVFNLYAFLGRMAYDADAVVIGQVNAATSHLTEDESFIYTNYEMTVEEVLKGDGA